MRKTVEMRSEPVPGQVFGQMLEHLPEEALVTDPAGVLRWANRKAVEMTGWTRRELRRLRLDRLVSVAGVVAIARARGRQGSGRAAVQTVLRRRVTNVGEVFPQCARPADPGGLRYRGGGGAASGMFSRVFSWAVDGVEMERVPVNLVQNAYKATASGRRVSVVGRGDPGRRGVRVTIRLPAPRRGPAAFTGSPRRQRDASA